MSKKSGDNEQGHDSFANEFSHLQSDGLGGFEALTPDVVTIPFIRILQMMSPQLNAHKPEYIEGAKAGMLCNSSTNKVYSPPVELVVGRFDRCYIAWKPSRGGYAGAYSPGDVAAMIAQGNLRRNDKGRIIDPDSGNEYSDTYIYYVLLTQHLADGVCLLSLSNTQLKEARRWNRLLLSTFIPGTNKRALPYHMRWNITTPYMSNDNGSWYGIKVEFSGFVGKEAFSLVSAARDQIVDASTDLGGLAIGSAEDYDHPTDTAPF